MTDHNEDTETYISLLLADGNLPTGSFVASSGLESFVTHGFFNTPDTLNHTINFVRDSVATYAKSALPFVSDTHRILANFAAASSPGELLDSSVADAKALDDLYEAMTLNHVSKRASKSQGVALLTLYSRGFARLASVPLPTNNSQYDREAALTQLLERYKLMIRKEEAHGHIPICWGLLTAALGLSLERCQYLHLFLHARNLLSASVRLNTIGPYASQQVLLHAIRPIVEAELSKSKSLRTGVLSSIEKSQGITESSFNETTDGPASTWPLGDILTSRHDLQHSRIFNS